MVVDSSVEAVVLGILLDLNTFTQSGGPKVLRFSRSKGTPESPRFQVHISVDC